MKTIPSFVASRLAVLDDHRETVTAWARGPITKAEMLRRQLGEMRMQVASAEANLAPDAQRMQHLETEATRVEAQIEQHVDEYRRRSELAVTADLSVSTAKDFLARLKDSVQLEPLPPTKLTGNGDPKRLLAATRNAIADKAAALNTMRRSRLPAADIRARAEAFVARAARSQSLVPSVWPGDFTLRFQRAGADPSSMPNPLPLFAELMPAQLVEAICAAAERVPAGPEGLPEAERPARIIELERDLDGLECQEEALINAIIDSFGPTQVQRRRDARPEILLGVTVTSKPKNVPPATFEESFEQQLDRAEAI